MCLLSSVACLYRSLRNEHIWFLYLNLKVVSQSPMYVSFRYIYIYNFGLTWLKRLQQKKLGACICVYMYPCTYIFIHSCIGL